MPRSLTFMYRDNSFTAALIKVDRGHLYGSVSVQTDDMDGRRCEVATLASNGKTLIPKGGTALGYVNAGGDWVTRDKLQAVNLAGEPAEEVPSSFDAPISLESTSDIESFLDHSVRLVYRLESEDGFPDEWLASLANSDVYQFGFSYRGGIGYDPAFILADDNNDVWMMITEANDVQPVGLEQAAICAGETSSEEDEVDDNDSIDFGML